jgi:N-methylhydantoinase A/oxoprolinase/acetone carboxylase beta subunit
MGVGVDVGGTFTDLFALGEQSLRFVRAFERPVGRTESGSAVAHLLHGAQSVVKTLVK